IASVDGEVRMVRNLPAKLEAAKGDPSVKRFFHPSLDADASVAVLVGAEFDRIQAALANKGGLNTIAVRDVSELLESVVTEDAVVFAALAGSYFGRRFTQPATDEPVGRAARFLGAAMERRYFDVLASHLITGDVSAVVRLLEAWTGFWVRHQRYPHGFGQRLRRLILSVPTSIRVRKLNTQLLSVQSCINLSQCAAGQDAEDVLDLYRVVTGGTANPPGNQPARKQPPKPGRKGRSSTLDIVLAEIEQEHLTAVICLPIDTARASFLLDSVTAENPVQALEIITSFYIHLQRYTDRSAGSPTFEEAGPEAQLLLERAFARKGGTAAALAETQSGIEGGLRFVLDQMTEQLKRECQEKHVLHVLATAVNPLDWEAKVKFIKELFHRCRALLPAELTSEPPERFARDYERIVRLYVNALAEMKQVLRAL
ncbi:MAG: hypothetical protein WCL11_24515, partial [Verrucomicrobiota bacterium]